MPLAVQPDQRQSRASLNVIASSLIGSWPIALCPSNRWWRRSARRSSRSGAISGELAEAGKLRRVHGGAEPAGETRHVFVGRSFERNQHRNVAAKRRIARRRHPSPGMEAVIIDGGTTTHQMSSLLAGRGMQVLTNSLHIVQSLITDASTRLLVPGGEVFPAQNIILSTSGNDGLSDYRAKYMFMGAEAVCEDGIRQSDSLLAHSERRLIDLADKLVVLADESKFAAQAGFLVCPSRELLYDHNRSVTPAGARRTLGRVRHAGDYRAGKFNRGTVMIVCFRF